MTVESIRDSFRAAEDGSLQQFTKFVDIVISLRAFIVIEADGLQAGGMCAIQLRDSMTYKDCLVGCQVQLFQGCAIDFREWFDNTNFH